MCENIEKRDLDAEGRRAQAQELIRTLQARIVELEREKERLCDEIEFWMGPIGPPPQTCPQDFEWRSLRMIPKTKRTPEQIDRLRDLARQIRILGDPAIQRRTAEILAEWLRTREGNEPSEVVILLADAEEQAYEQIVLVPARIRDLEIKRKMGAG